MVSAAFERENKSLIEYMKGLGYLKSPQLEKALLKTPRHLFVPSHLSDIAYRDIPLSIGFGQTISQPSTVVIMTELLKPKQGQKILEVGTGSGWQAALLARLVSRSGFVYTIEKIRELVEYAKENLKKLDIKNIFVVGGDGSQGLEKFAPYDRIIVTAACPEVPKLLVKQLKTGGKMVLPIGDLYTQKMTIIKKTESGLKKEELAGYFVFVPLIGEYGFR